MNDTLHDLIDGRGNRAELSKQDGERLRALEATIEGAARPLRTTASPDLSARVMAEVRHVRIEPTVAGGFAAAARRMLDRMWAPRVFTVQLRPGFAMAALGIALFWVGTSFSSSVATPEGIEMVGTESTAPPVYVQFRLEAQGAARVALAGSFTDWRPTYQMRETASGVWSIMLPLRPGIHDYAFVVDGDRWVADPHALQVDDGFGGSNSRIALPALPAHTKQL